MLHIRNGERDQTNLWDSEQQREVLLKYDRSVSGLITFGYALKNFFIKMANWQIESTSKKRFQIF